MKIFGFWSGKPTKAQYDKDIEKVIYAWRQMMKQ